MCCKSYTRRLLLSEARKSYASAISSEVELCGIGRIVHAGVALMRPAKIWFFDECFFRGRGWEEQMKGSALSSHSQLWPRGFSLDTWKCSSPNKSPLKSSGRNKHLLTTVAKDTCSLPSSKAWRITDSRHQYTRLTYFWEAKLSFLLPFIILHRVPCGSQPDCFWTTAGEFSGRFCNYTLQLWRLLFGGDPACWITHFLF